MSSVLILLALLSLATLASRRGGMAALLASSLPAFAAGLIAGPNGLHYISVAGAAALTPATAVGVCWLGVVLGWRLTADRPRARAVVRSVFVLAIGAAAAAGLALLAARLTTTISIGAVVATGLIGAAVILPFSAAGADPDDKTGHNSRAVDLVAVVAVAVAVGLLDGLQAPVMLLMVVLIGMLAGGAALLVGGHDNQRRFPAVLSVTVMLTALATGLHVPVGIAGVGVGVGLAIIDRDRHFGTFLAGTDGPVRLVAAFLVATLVPLSVASCVLAVALGLVQLLVIYFTSVDDDPTTSRFDTAVLRAASTSTGLLLLGGFLLMPLVTAHIGPTITGALGLSAIIVDVVAVGLLLARKGRRARGSAP